MKKTEEIDFNVYPSYNTLEMGGHKFSLVNFKEIVGHDDSLPYCATLVIDGKKVCNLYNDGWGGETDMVAIIDQALIDKANEDIKDLPYPYYPWEKNTVSTIFNDLKAENVLTIANTIAETMAWIEEGINTAKEKVGDEPSVIMVKGNALRCIVCREGYEKVLRKNNKEGWYVITILNNPCPSIPAPKDLSIIKPSLN